MASLAESGQQTPIVVVLSTGERERYLVIDGYKRIAALEQTGPGHDRSHSVGNERRRSSTPGMDFALHSPGKCARTRLAVEERVPRVAKNLPPNGLRVLQVDALAL